MIKRSVKFLALIYVSIFLCLSADAMHVRVLIQSNKIIRSVIFTAVNSNYYIYSGKKKILTLKQNESVTINSADTAVQLSSSKKEYGGFSELRFVGRNNNSVFSLKRLDSSTQGTSYYNHLEVISKNKSLRFFNVVDLEKYVEGTVAAEAGNDASPEFYKVQAIICRTYLLGHLQRHAAEGFNLCDGVHCQAYNGISRINKTIVTAVTETKNKIIVDSASNIIIAAYHNNCGGETAAAEDVWSKPLPYLQPVQDPFCRNSLHASWEKKISLKDWLNYLQKKKPATICTDMAAISDTTFCHFPKKREALLSFPNVAISSRSIRDDWRFRSAYFTINQSGDTLIFNGRGFGHGVGLCQEGAMQMAKYGYSYQEIINFYYKNVFIVDDKEIHSLYVSR